MTLDLAPTARTVARLWTGLRSHTQRQQVALLRSTGNVTSQKTLRSVVAAVHMHRTGLQAISHVAEVTATAGLILMTRLHTAGNAQANTTNAPTQTNPGTTSGGQALQTVTQVMQGPSSEALTTGVGTRGGDSGAGGTAAEAEAAGSETMTTVTGLMATVVATGVTGVIIRKGMEGAEVILELWDGLHNNPVLMRNNGSPTAVHTRLNRVKV